MPRPTSKPTDRWAALLADEIQRETRQPTGEGWITAPELRAQLRCGRSQLQHRLVKLKARKAIETFVGTGINPVSGYIMRKVWYRIL